MIDTNIVYYDKRINKLFTVKEKRGNKIIVGGMCNYYSDAKTCALRFSMSPSYLENCIPLDNDSLKINKDAMVFLWPDNIDNEPYKLKEENEISFYGDDFIKYMHMQSIKEMNHGSTYNGHVHVIYSAEWCHCFWNLFSGGYKEVGFHYWFSKSIFPFERSEEHFTIYFGWGELCFGLKGSKPAYFTDRKGLNFFRWIWACTDICREITIGEEE